MNYKHLYYFWIIANTGSIVRASEQLHLTPQTICGQLSKLEEEFGEMLFTRSGRNLEINDTGRLVFKYANEIFNLGTELEETVHKLPANPLQVFKVGIADVVPKTIAYRLLEPTFHLSESVRIVCEDPSGNIIELKQ